MTDEAALRIVALSESLRLLDHVVSGDRGGFVERKFWEIRNMLGDALPMGLVRDAERKLSSGHTEYE